MNTGYRLCLALSILTAALPAAAQRRVQRKAQPPPAYMAQLASFEQRPPVTRVSLKDGTRVLIYESGSVPVAAVVTVLEYGRGDENPDEAGAAELLARLIPSRSLTVGAEDAVDDVQALGGTWRVEVRRNNTAYETVVPSSQWKQALEIHSKLLLRPQWSEEDLKREILFGKAPPPCIEPEPDESARATFLELAYPDIGSITAPSVSAGEATDLNDEKLTRFLRRLHQPARTILVVCGNVIASEVLTEVVKDYGKGPRSKPYTRVAKQAQPGSGFRYHQRRDDLPAASVVVGYRVPSAASPDYPALMVLRALLASGDGSALSRRVRDEQAAVLDTSAGLVFDGDYGGLVLRITAAPENIDRSEIAVLTELEIIKAQPPAAEELARAQAQLETEYWQGIQTVTEKARILAHHESQGNWKQLFDRIEPIRKITPEDVTRVARKYIRLENTVLIEILPRSSEERNLTQESMLELLQGLLPASVEQELARRERETRPEYKLSAQPLEFTASELVQPMKRASILRGPELYIREDHSQPMIYMGFFYPGGRILEDESNAGITALLLRSLLRGSTETEAEVLHKQIELYGGRIVPVLEHDYFGVMFSVLAANVEPALTLLIEMFKSPALDNDEILRQKGMLAVERREESRSIAAGVRRVAAQTLFGAHPYALPALGSEESLASLSPDTVRLWFEKTVRLSKPLVIIVGDTSGTALAEYFVKNFSGSRYRDNRLPESFPDAVAKTEPQVGEWHCGRTVIWHLFQSPPWNDEDSPALELLRHYLAVTEDRFYPRFREGQPFILARQLAAESYARAGFMEIQISIPPAEEEKAENLLDAWFARLSEGTLSYRDLRAARYAAIAAHYVRSQSRKAQIEDLAQGILSGVKLEELRDRVTQLQDVRMEDLPEVAKRFLSPERAITLLRRGQQRP